MTNETTKERLEREIPVIFKNEKFPEAYKNDVAYWGNLSKEEIHTCLPDGTAKILTMDIDFGDECSLRCPHCFRRDERFDSTSISGKLTDEEILNYIKEAKELGLKQIKILGRGEPFQNKKFLGFLRQMTEWNIGVAIFTKGHVIGSDNLAKIYNQDYGINNSTELVKELKKLKVSILLGFNTFDKKMQEEFIGIDICPIKNYVELRDRALILLTKEGFNEDLPGEPTRLAMISAPIKPENIDEILEIYKWGRLRNIYVLSCPTTISGKGIDEFKRALETYDNGKGTKNPHMKYLKDLENLYVNIYTWAIQTNLISKDKFIEEGVSLYPGCHPCNQTAGGFYLNLSGQVNQCPGRCDVSTIFSNDIRKEKSLKDVWKNSINYKRAKFSNKYNFRCPARDGHSIPSTFYSKVKRKVLEKIK
ncbi:MAG: radical SAM protein [Nanoarchaeota archaeon]|jgi:hypothetical protein|nr:radical SAM protein [Nanoarchaeota archaeon]